MAASGTLPRLRLLQLNLRHSRNDMPQRTNKLPIGALASVVSSYQWTPGPSQTQGRENRKVSVSMDTTTLTGSSVWVRVRT